MLKQSNGYGCGMYAVANALALDNYATEARLEESREKGNVIGQLSRWLQQDGHDATIDVFWYDHYGKKLPETYFKFKVSECRAALFMFNVTLTEKGKRHMIAAHLMSNGNLIVCDSLRSEPFTTTIAEINNHYHTVFGFFCFMNLKGDYLFFQ